MRDSTAGESRTQPRRIALLLPELNGGGAQRVMLTLAHGFWAQGVQVDLVVVRAKGPLLEDIPAGVTLVSLRSPKTIWSLPRLIWYLKAKRPDALLVTNVHCSFVAILARTFVQTPPWLVVRQSSPFSLYQSSVQRRMTQGLVRWLYPKANAIVAVSQGIAGSLISDCGIACEQVHVIPSPLVPINISELVQEPISHPWFTPKTLPVIIGIGRLEQEKDFVTLIHAFARVQRSMLTRLLILGEGTQRATLHSLVRTLGLENRVSLPGFVRNPFAYLSRASVFVLSSVAEALPGVLVQALACGVPIVSTNCHYGPREVLQNGEIGRLVPVGDDTAIAEAIIGVLRQPPIRANPRVWQAYSYDTAIAKYLTLLESRTTRE
jgi:glycosyltransferase involved in cell wall biosynthesis